MFKKTRFEIVDCSEKNFEGYTDGQHWNGWECPRFTKEIGLLVMEQFSYDEPLKAYFDESKDAFIFPVEDSEPDVYEGVDITCDGDILHVYAIGAWGWVWDEYEEPVTDPNMPKCAECEFPCKSDTGYCK